MIMNNLSIIDVFQDIVSSDIKEEWSAKYFNNFNCLFFNMSKDNVLGTKLLKSFLTKCSLTKAEIITITPKTSKDEIEVIIDDFYNRYLYMEQHTINKWPKQRTILYIKDEDYANMSNEAKQLLSDFLGSVGRIGRPSKYSLVLAHNYAEPTDYFRLSSYIYDNMSVIKLC